MTIELPEKITLNRVDGVEFELSLNSELKDRFGVSAGGCSLGQQGHMSNIIQLLKDKGIEPEVNYAKNHSGLSGIKQADGDYEWVPASAEYVWWIEVKPTDTERLMELAN